MCHSLYTTSLYLVMFRLDLKIFFLNGCSPKYPVWRTTYPKVKIFKIRRAVSASFIIHNAQTKGTHYKSMVKSKQWRIQDFPGGGGLGANSQSGCVNLLFCRKLHENERIWAMRVARKSLAPPLDPPMQYIKGDGCTSWSTYIVL